MPIGIYVRTKRTRKMLSEAHKGKKRQPFSKEHRKHLSEALTGKSHPHKGVPFTEAAKLKSSEARKGKKGKYGTVKTLKRKIWDIFSKYIRLKYADKNGMVECYTCGTKKFWKEMQAGHGFSGRENSILFDEEIVRPQCKYCNIYRQGNYDIFHAKLIKEYGIDILDRKIRQKNTVKKFTSEELHEKYEHYRLEVEKLLKNYMRR